ncbi:MAG: type I-U CRISPR-associated protein Csx17 [Candidatus Paceibacterota bacterium]
MNQTTLQLRGCSPTPLAHYLKALGILRLVSEQADAEAMGWWQNDVFCLRSKLDAEALVRFFLEEYKPTPLVGPWGARSGFFPSASERSAREALDQILASEQPRLVPFQSAITAVHSVLAELGLAEKADSDDEKLQLLQMCRAKLDDDLLPWLDAVYVLLNEGRAFPPLLGTGGNEGSGSYMSGFAQQVVAVIENRSWDAALRPAIFGDVAVGVGDKQTPGHFFPDAAGGPNAAAGFDGAVGTNPWDYLLTLEGTLLFAASAVKQLEEHADGNLAFPFCVRPAGVGYASADIADEAAARAEMWFPLWTRPTTRSELEALLGEGRATVNRRKVRNGIDFARAVASLGVDRGVSRFERFGFQQRNGLSYFAIPLGTFDIPKQEVAAASLLDPLDRWLDRFRRAATGKQAPARAGRALRQLESSILGLCQRGDSAAVQAVLVALGEAEAAIAISKQLREGERGSGISPVPMLSNDWLFKANDQTCEFRLAAALASVTHDQVGPLRRHLEPIDKTSWKSAYPKWAKEGNDPGMVWGGGNLVRNLNAVLARRFVEVLQQGKERNERELLTPVGGRQPASLGDITAFINGQVDDLRIEALVRGLMLIHWSRFSNDRVERLRGPRHPVPDAAYSLLKLCHLPFKLDDQLIPLAPQLTRRAIGGDGAEATRLAARRLRAAGLPPAVEVVPCTRQRAHRVAAALMFPISIRDAQRLVALVLRRDQFAEDVKPIDPVSAVT